VDDHKQVEKGQKYSIKNSLIKGFLSIVAVMVVALVVVVTYLQLVTFEKIQEIQSAASYYESIKEQLVYTKEGLMVEIPEKVIGTEIAKKLAESLDGPNDSIENLYYDGQTQTLHINSIYLGFYMPLAYKVAFVQHGEQIGLVYQEVKIGKNKKSMPVFLEKWVRKSKLTKALEQVLFVPKEFVEYKGMYLEKVVPKGTMLALIFNVKMDQVQSTFEAIKSNVNESLRLEAEESNNTYAHEAAQLLKQSEALSEDQVERIITNIKEDQQLIEYLLVLSKESATKDLIQQLENYGVSVQIETINQKRLALLGEKIDVVADLILDTLGNHFYEKTMAYNQGKPFDIERFTTVTVAKLVAWYGLNIDASLVDQLYFVQKEGFGVSNEIVPDSYYIKYLDSYEVISKEVYEEMLGAGPYKEATYVEDLTLWKEIMKPIKLYLGVEKVYVRYMKSDGESAFIIASPEDEPQEYWSFALYKKQGFQIVESNVKNRLTLLSKYPFFNIDTATEEIETVKLKRISDSIYQTILEEMHQLGKLTYSKEYTIDYSSYDGKYISFLLSNGEAYVYKVETTSFGTYLTTVYSKEKALRNWSDLPEIIMLQKIPEE